MHRTGYLAKVRVIKEVFTIFWVDLRSDLKLGPHLRPPETMWELVQVQSHIVGLYFRAISRRGLSVQ